MRTITTNTDILFCAFRYALGRKTSIVNEVVNEIIRLWDDIPAPDKILMQAEIRLAIEKGEAGMQFDVWEWEKILNL